MLLEEQIKNERNLAVMHAQQAQKEPTPKNKDVYMRLARYHERTAEHLESLKHIYNIGYNYKKKKITKDEALDAILAEIK